MRKEGVEAPGAGSEVPDSWGQDAESAVERITARYFSERKLRGHSVHRRLVESIGREVAVCAARTGRSVHLGPFDLRTIARKVAKFDRDRYHDELRESQPTAPTIKLIRAALNGIVGKNGGRHQLGDEETVVHGTRRLFALAVEWDPEKSTLVLELSIAPELADSVRSVRSAWRLPSAASFFVGRDEEIATVLHAIERETRQIFISGLSGAGRTELALQIAKRVAEVFPDVQLRAECTYPDGTSLEPLALLNQIIARLAPEERLPASTDDATATLRKVTRNGSGVLILDDVQSHMQLSCSELLGSQWLVLATGQKLPRTQGFFDLKLGSVSVDAAGALARRLVPDSDLELSPKAYRTLRHTTAFAQLPRHSDVADLIGIVADGLPGLVHWICDDLRAITGEHLEDEVLIRHSNRLVAIGNDAEDSPLRDLERDLSRLHPRTARRLRWATIFHDDFDDAAANAILDDPDGLILRELVKRNWVFVNEESGRCRIADCVWQLARAEEEFASEIGWLARRHAEYFIGTWASIPDHRDQRAYSMRETQNVTDSAYWVAMNCERDESASRLAGLIAPNYESLPFDFLLQKDVLLRICRRGVEWLRSHGDVDARIQGGLAVCELTRDYEEAVRAFEELLALCDAQTLRLFDHPILVYVPWWYHSLGRESVLSKIRQKLAGLNCWVSLDSVWRDFLPERQHGERESDV